MAAAVIKKAVIVNVRTTAHDHLRDHPCHPPHGRQRGSEEEEDHGHVPQGAEMAAAVVNRAVIVNVRATAHDHLRDHPCPSPPSRSTEGVRRRGGSRSRPPIRRNGSSRGQQSRHSQRESDRPRSSSRSPLPPPSRSTEGTRGGSRSSSSFLHRYHLPLSHVLHRLPSLLLSRVIKEKSWQYRAAQEARI